NPELGAVENAERYFEKAKRAKARAGELAGQSKRLEQDRSDLVAMLERLEGLERWPEVEALRDQAAAPLWLPRPGTAGRKEERPFEGHAVRELLSPGGWRVLYGENATANDYLTTRVAKPADLWFHVRGSVSAHVVLATNNQPDRVQLKDLEYAA